MSVFTRCGPHNVDSTSRSISSVDLPVSTRIRFHIDVRFDVRVRIRFRNLVSVRIRVAICVRVRIDVRVYIRVRVRTRIASKGSFSAFVSRLDILLISRA